jgi:hypothetical protein
MRHLCDGELDRSASWVWSKGVEDENEIKWRTDFWRQIGYKQ